MPTRTPVMVLGEDVWPVVRATLGRDAQAMLPAPDDEPESDDEPDDEPGTLYFGGATDGRLNPAEGQCHAPAARRSRHRETGGPISPSRDQGSSLPSINGEVDLLTYWYTGEMQEAILP